jgi:hypothetical protein
MPHLHYSPFQFATSEQVSDDAVMPAKKQIAKMRRMTAKDKITPKLLSRDEAHMITGTPQAFTSPNAVDVMRTIKSVFGC